MKMVLTTAKASRRWRAATACFALLSSPALADVSNPHLGAGDGANNEAAPSPFQQKPVTDEVLSSTAGREGMPSWVSASTDSVAVVESNSVGDNSNTGTIAISDNAFQNLRGIAMVNVNSGNSSAINASMNLNVIITGPSGM